MLRKFMSKLGVGSAKIDLVLDHNSYRLGETINGEIHIDGGTVEQQINKIEVDFVVAMKIKDQEVSRVIATIPVTQAFTVQADEKKVISFDYALANDLLLSRHTVSYYFKTKLDIAGGVDSLDTDPVIVQPPKALEQVFLGMQQLGLRENATSGKFNGYVQEFEFFPTTLFLQQVEEVEMVGGVQGDQIQILLEVDVRKLGFSETELVKEVTFNKEELENVDGVAHKIQSIIEEMLQSPHSYNKRNIYPQGNRHLGQKKSSMIPGAIGGFAAGIFGGMILSELMEDTFEEIGIEDMSEETEGFDLGDLFGGGDDEF